MSQTEIHGEIQHSGSLPLHDLRAPAVNGWGHFLMGDSVNCFTHGWGHLGLNVRPPALSLATAMKAAKMTNDIEEVTKAAPEINDSPSLKP
jgi:hypothetical protein